MNSWLVSIVTVISAGLVALAYAGYRFQAFRATAPALMTSLGILGTFAGILVAMRGLDFSVGQMNVSVEQMLEGMQPAFVTSLLGLASAIVFRSLEPAFPSTFTPTPEQREIFDRLDAIKDAIAGAGEYSVASRSTALRTDVVDQFRGLREESLNGFAVLQRENRESMAALQRENREGFATLQGLPELLQDTLKSALGDIADTTNALLKKQLEDYQREYRVLIADMVRNIEEKLIEQFGVAFTRFNEGLDTLIAWQRNHRHHVEEMTKAFKNAERNLAKTAEGCERIPVTMEKLRELLSMAHSDVESLSPQVHSFVEQLESFVAMRREAEGVFPAVKEHLDDIVERMSRGAQGFATTEERFAATEARLQEALQFIEKESAGVVQKLMADVEAAMKDALEKSGEQQAKIVQEQERIAREVASSVAGAMEKFDARVDGALEASGRRQRETADKMASMMKATVEQFEADMLEAAERSSKIVVEITKRVAEIIRKVEGRGQ